MVVFSHLPLLTLELHFHIEKNSYGQCSTGVYAGKSGGKKPAASAATLNRGVEHVTSDRWISLKSKC